MATRADIDQLAAWLAETDIATLELHEAEGSLCLGRRSGAIEIFEPASACSKASPHRSLTVTADTPGIFLHAHPLRTAPLVAGGPIVEARQVVGLLRVGALLLPVRAPFAGRVEGYWAEDGTQVGYGAPLIELQVSEASR
jgi:acetyl-CoA carboxylase biotin carboxyl carrier protein